MSTIPILETQRLRLRPHQLEDLDVCTAMWGNPLVTQYIGGRAFTREEVWARLLRYAGHWAWLGFGFWAVEERESRRFLGEIGLADFKREVQPPLDDGPEAGWVLVPDAHGQGFATEALRAVTAWSDDRGTARRMTCLIHPDNKASVKVAGKCGFHNVRRALYKGQMSEVMVRDSIS